MNDLNPVIQVAKSLNPPSTERSLHLSLNVVDPKVRGSIFIYDPEQLAAAKSVTRDLTVPENLASFIEGQFTESNFSAFEGVCFNTFNCTPQQRTFTHIGTVTTQPGSIGLFYHLDQVAVFAEMIFGPGQQPLILNLSIKPEQNEG